MTRRASLVALALALGVGAAPVVLATAPALDVDVRSRAIRPGEVVAIAVRTPSPAQTPSATLAGRPIPLWRVAPTSWRGIAGLDVEQAPGPLALVVSASPADGSPLSSTTTLDVVPAAFRERRLSVDPRFVEPPPEARPRIAREAAALHAIYDRVSADRQPAGFVAPVPHRRSSPFGSRSIFNGVPRDRHAGLDFASPAGAVIRAPAAGRVALVDDLYYTGNTVVLDHGAGVYSILAHMQRTFVEGGQAVARGARLGTVGATGRATGPHLHWSVRVGGTRVDPASVLEVLQDRPRPAGRRRANQR
jgi:murein DD-endopeptidase MepM/ murein hydrolase activator NlpD